MSTPPTTEPVIRETHRVFQVTSLSKYLAATLFIILPFVGGWIGYVYAPEKVVEIEKVIELKPDTVVAETPASTIPSTYGPGTTTAYIVDVNKREGQDVTTILVDAMEILYGKEAEEALRADGMCVDAISCRDLLNSHPPFTYDRNNDAQVEMLTLSKNIEVYDWHGRPTTIDALPLSYFVLEGKGVGIIYELTLNEDKQVTKINGVFRP